MYLYGLFSKRETKKNVKFFNFMKISILGGGNVAFHLAKIISEMQGLELLQIYNRSELSFHFETINTHKINTLQQLIEADIYFICVKDEAISCFSEKIPFENRLVVHTSGNTDMLALSAKNKRGVLYPVQSFTKEKSVDFSQIPLCIEAENQKDAVVLQNFAQKISSKIYSLNSLQRKYLHISAVFLNNFTNHLWFLSEKICQENHIDFEILRPLLQETFTKTQFISFEEAQTGPAKRGDMTTLHNHISLLQETTKEIYITITNSILNTYGRKKL